MNTRTSASPSALGWHQVVELARNGNVTPPRRVEKSNEQWRAVLTADQYDVARRKGTEQPFSSALCSLFEPGRYHCVCCDTPLFDSTSKFQSGTGWPSFTGPVAPDVVAYELDPSYGMQGVEANCNVCDAHLGHVFPDGPPPSGLRFCINAVSLRKASE
jgi:peptide-methionine (R)-S-oxide reductase